MKKIIKISSLDGLSDAAREFINSLPDGASVIAFHGEMGAGKTTFIRKLVEILGVDPEEANSPSFSIINEYRSDTTAELIYHFDCYRLNDLDEALEIGVEDYLDSGALCLLEWPDNIADLLPFDTVDVTVDADHQTGERTITIETPDE